MNRKEHWKPPMIECLTEGVEKFNDAGKAIGYSDAAIIRQRGN